MSLRNWLIFSFFLILLFLLRLTPLRQPHLVPGTKVKISATLSIEPKEIGGLQTFSLLGLKIKTWRYPEYHYGEKLVVVGIVKEGILEFPEIKKIEEQRGFFVWLNQLRRGIEKNYQKTLPEPQASLLSGIVLGSKSSLPKDFYQDLQKTGTMHVVVASGMNVSILAGTMLSFLLLFFSRRIAVIFSFILIWFYVVLAGAEVPIVRAAIMGSLALLAQGLGREEDAWRGLAFSAIFLLFLNPQNLFDLGFQLSFASTFGILFFGPFFSKLFNRLPKQVRSDLSQTLGAQIMTMPIILFSFGSYSLFSPIVNILLVWILPWTMRLGLIAAIFPLTSWLTLPFLTYFVWIVEFFSKI